ncbi:MAG: hypothetical protein ACFE8L_11535 [Candidatus Hodarchaeota archaeon]
MINETEYYFNLLKEFSSIRNDIYQRELWRDEKIIELMKISEKITYRKFIQNSLIFIMSLFNENFIDSYECESKIIDDLADSERQILLSTLKVEII